MNNVIEIELLFHLYNIFVINCINRIIFVILKRFVYDLNNRFFFENCKNENKKLFYSRDNDFNDHIALDLNQNTLFILLYDINFQTNKILKFEICWNVVVKICKFVDCKIVNKFDTKQNIFCNSFFWLNFRIKFWNDLNVVEKLFVYCDAKFQISNVRHNIIIFCLLQNLFRNNIKKLNRVKNILSIKTSYYCFTFWYCYEKKMLMKILQIFECDRDSNDYSINVE